MLASSYPLHRRAWVFLAATALALGGVGPVTAAGPADAVAREVARARRVVPDLGVAVVELAGGATVYEHGADRLLVPASNQKLLTTAAALDALGLSYTFATPLGYRGAVRDGVLDGDLAVRGSGDPNISGRFHGGDPYAVFRRWAWALKAGGIHTVGGDLYLEHGLFDGSVVHPDWPRDQLQHWYEAPVDALSFNDNVFRVMAWGGAGAGRSGVVRAVPDLTLYRLANRLSTTSQSRQHSVQVRKAPGAEEVQVSGRVYRYAQPVEVWVTVNDPVAYFGAALRDALGQAGISVGGETRLVERLPGPWWRLLATHRSGLAQTLDVTNKRSQNFYAESLFKLLGAERCGDGSWQGGERAVREFLAGVFGPGREDFRIADGSGMSRQNRATARLLVDLLVHMWGHPWGKPFVQSLPYSGEEGGSLRTRMTEPPYYGNVFAKTGTLSGVSTLSGYVKARSGRIYAFAILCNRASAWEGRRAQDRIVQALVDAG